MRRADGGIFEMAADTAARLVATPARFSAGVLVRRSDGFSIGDLNQ